MIKVWQIYYSQLLGGKIVVTFKRADETAFYAVRDDGYIFAGKCDGINKDYDKLLAEHPTWQEAVNSREFNDAT